MTYGKDNCGDCDGNYPAIASAFIRVPNNFDSVNNSIDKFTIYKTLSVAGQAVENVGRGQCGRRGRRGDRRGRGGDCAELGDSLCTPSSCCEAVDSLGFAFFPLRVRTDTAQVCGAARCASKGYRGDDDQCHDSCNGCGDAECGPGLLGFVQWPKHTMVRDIRACGPIETQIKCRRHGRRGCESCRVLLDCKDNCDSSSSSTTRTTRTSTSGAAAPGAGSRTTTCSDYRRRRRRHRRNHGNVGCGCGH